MRGQLVEARLTLRQWEILSLLLNAEAPVEGEAQKELRLLIDNDIIAGALFDRLAS